MDPPRPVSQQPPTPDASVITTPGERALFPRRFNGDPPAHGTTIECLDPPRPWEDTISTHKSVSWAHCEDFRSLEDVVLRATDRAAQLGCGAVSPGTGALLQVLASALRATAVVEIGTGAGVSGLWLLGGMAPDGILTTIDTEAEHQRAAKEAFTEAGVRPTRARTITGRALDVLPRLTDGAYDLVLADGDPLELAQHVEQALRLLRPGGVLAVAHALGQDRVPDPARRDEVTTALRQVARSLREDDRVLPALVPSGDGLLLASRR